MKRLLLLLLLLPAAPARLAGSHTGIIFRYATAQANFKLFVS